MKKYYVSNQENTGLLERTLIIADEENIEEKIELAGMVYTTDIDSIEDYKIEDYDGDATMTEEDAKDYTFADINEFTKREKEFIFNGWVYCEDMTEEEIERIKAKMKEHGTDCNWFETYKSWGYSDGSNWKEITLEHPNYSQYDDYTEEFEDMEEIGFERYNTGHRTLYRLKDESLILIDNSYYQGELWGVTFIPDTQIETMKEALEYIHHAENTSRNWN